jgi:hypothetical protein
MLRVLWMGPLQLRFVLHELVIECSKCLHKATMLVSEYCIEKDQEPLQGNPGLKSHDRNVDVAVGG